MESLLQTYEVHETQAHNGDFCTFLNRQLCNSELLKTGVL